MADEPLDVPTAPWSEVLPEFMELWEQGQHVIIIGRTGRGKTTFEHAILDARLEERDASVVIIETKPRDRTMQRLAREGWHVIKRWPPDYAARASRRVILWPPYSVPSRARATTGPVIVEALDEIMLEGGWTVCLDEAGYLVETLGLRHVLDEFWQGARTSGICLVAGSQRPVWIARGQVSQGDWAISFVISDEDDRERMAQVMGSRKLWKPEIARLRDHQLLLVNTMTQAGVVTTVEV